MPTYEIELTNDVVNALEVYRTKLEKERQKSAPKMTTKRGV